jgi:predicted nucleic acid-binding protein
MTAGEAPAPPANGRSEMIASVQAIAAQFDPAAPSYVIDTSVAVKWYVPETCSAEAMRYLDRRIDRHAPDYLLLEGASVVLKRSRRRPDDPDRSSVEQARVVNESLADTPIDYQPTGELIDRAFELAHEIGTSFYDGLFLALTLKLGGRLVTADRKLYDKVAATLYAPIVCWVEQEP